jgi:hypothetical protein
MFRRRLPPWDRLERNHFMETHDTNDRALGLFVVRSTDAYNGAVFRGDRAAVYNRNTAHLDGVPAVAALGLKLLRSETVDVPDFLGGGQVHVEHLTLRDGKAYLFKVGAHWHFWSKTSRIAPRATTELLRATIETLRPQNLFVSRVSSLVSRSANLNLLRPALVAHVDTVTTWVHERESVMTPEAAVDVISDALEARQQLQRRLAAGITSRALSGNMGSVEPAGRPTHCRESAPFNPDLFHALVEATVGARGVQA